MAKLSWEYIAGFFDGEGTIRLPKHGVHWAIAQSGARGLRVCEEIQQFLYAQGIASGIHLKRRRDGMYTLWVSKRQSVEVISKNLLPFLRIKKVETQDILRYFLIFPLQASHPSWSMLMRERHMDWEPVREKQHQSMQRRSRTSPGLPDPVKLG